MDKTQDPRSAFLDRVRGSEEKNEEKDIKQVSSLEGGTLHT